MKSGFSLIAVVLSACTLLAQSDRGTITGTVTDASGALIAGAKINLTNSETGFKSDTVTTDTGNYTVPGLAVGKYTLTVEQVGFTKYQQTNIEVQVAITARVNVVLQVGSTTDSVVVNAEASQLKTENAEISTTVTGKQINELPINFGIGAGAIRNPLSFAQLTPGASINGWNNITINGTNSGFKILFEGQESNSTLDPRVSDESQPSVEAVEEFTLQTSNFAAEFGSVGSGLFNFTSRSGTNQFHGSGYDYLQNTVFNAGIPWTDNGHGGHVQNVKHLSDGGFTIGGPVWIPKVYNGKNKTFFFFNWEKYRDRENLYNGITTVPNSVLRSGNFSSILGPSLGTDFAGRPILQNAIYDPNTQVTNANGQRVLQMFPGNIIPASRIDPTSAKILAQIPTPNISDTLVNNFTAGGAFYKLQLIPSIKVDQVINSKMRISGYYSWENTDKSNGVDGLPEPISQVRIQVIRSKTFRLNYDYTISPTLLLHLGGGVIRYTNPDTVPPASSGFDNTTLGIINAPGTGYPRIPSNGTNNIGNNTYGGQALAIGPGSRGLIITTKPTGVAQLTWVRGNHTFKTGAEFKIDSFTNISYIGLSPLYNFSTAETAQPLYGQTLPSGTSIGYSFASFLLGQYDSASIGNTVAPQYRRNSWGIFLQDTWKITNKLTLDYGLRWDLQTPNKELWDRTSGFDPVIANPNANGRLGGVVYDGYGAGRCNCSLIATYPYAIAPRLGIAYQLSQKTVLRGGWGLSYGQLSAFNYIGGGNSQGMGFNTINFNSPGNNVAAGTISNPLVYSQTALNGASYDPGLLVNPGGAVQGAPASIDPNGGRPPRVNQWNVSIQHQLMKDLVIEGAYVGNRGAWLQAPSGLQSAGTLISYNAINPAVYQALGLDLTNASTRSLLTSTITSPVAVAAGFKKPYASFPDNGTVIQSLRPFPQYNGIGSLWAPLGASWYNAFQGKITKRYSKGLTLIGSYSFSKTLDNYEGAGNIFNRNDFKGLSSQDRPQILSISVNYTVPAVGFVNKNTFTRMVFANWTIGTILQYSSAALLAAPTSNNSLGTYLPGISTRQFRVPGVSPYLKDINCGCIDPTKETVLNPAAWSDQAAGVFGSGAIYYTDFRSQRRPVESLSLGKAFPFKERFVFSIRGEFFNPLNRNESISDPVTSSPSLAPTRNPQGFLTGGFGFQNYNAITSNSVGGTIPSPRTGQIVARFQF
jgi:Carboxypeptidase regulatory-like domain